MPAGRAEAFRADRNVLIGRVPPPAVHERWPGARPAGRRQPEMVGGTAVPILDAESIFSPEPCSSTDADLTEALRLHGAAVICGLPQAARLGDDRASALCAFLSLPPQRKAEYQVAVQNSKNQNRFWGWYARHQGPPGSEWLYNEHMQMGPEQGSGHQSQEDWGCTWCESEGCLRTMDRHTPEADPHFAPSPWPPEAVLPGWRGEMRRYRAAMERCGEAVLRAVVRHMLSCGGEGGHGAAAAALGVADEHEAAELWRAGGVSTLRIMRCARSQPCCVAWPFAFQAVHARLTAPATLCDCSPVFRDECHLTGLGALQTRHLHGACRLATA
jgi:hypothetical protein